MPEGKAKWKGASGRTYEYHVYKIGTQFKHLPGNYIYARVKRGFWDASYVGQTKDLGDRLADHEALPCVRRQGATHIHVHVNEDGEKARVAEEADLIVEHQPVCNTHKKAAE